MLLIGFSFPRAAVACAILEKTFGFESSSETAASRYSRLSLSRNRRDPQKQFEISVFRHIRFVVLRKKQLEQPNFTNDYVIWLL